MTREPERVNSDTSDPSGLQMAEASLVEASAAAGVKAGGDEREETVACSESSVSIFKG